MASDELEVTPAGLWGASGIIAAHGGQVASAAGSLRESAELSGAAAGAVHGAFDGYCLAFSQRLTSASAALAETASVFTAMDKTNSQMLAFGAPGGCASVREG